MPSWTGNITSQAPVAGPAGLYYADVPNRIIAWVIDFIILFVVFAVIGIVVNSVLGTDTVFGRLPNTTSVLVASILNLAVSAGYLIYTWVAMRATLGMKVLGMQVGHEADGRTIDYSQAAIRYAVLFGPYIVATMLGAFVFGLGLVLQLLGIVWFIVLLVTTAQSPTKQGLHDRYARTMVVKGGRSAT